MTSAQLYFVSRASSRYDAAAPARARRSDLPEAPRGDVADNAAGGDQSCLGRRARRQPAVRQVVLGQLQQERVELLAFLVRQRHEEVVLDAGRELAQLVQHLAAGRRHLDDLPSPVSLVALPAHEARFLELVEQPDELALVVAERVGDRARRLARTLVENGEDRVVVRVEAGVVERAEALLLSRHPEPLEQ